ncbi:MAG: hypothetical protein AAFU85_19695 [Planctomycetota bacterium]
MYHQRLLLGVVTFVGLTSAVRSEPPVCHVAPAAQTQLRVSRHVGQLLPRRILIVTGKNLQDRLREQTLFAEALADHLRRSAFQVIVSQDCLCKHRWPLSLGRFDEREVLRAAKEHRADTILYAEVSSIEAYDPMRVQGSILLVNVDEAVSVLSETSTVDLQRGAAKRAFLAFARGAEQDSFGETFLHSPAKLIDFTAREMARTLLQTWTEPPTDNSDPSGGTLR